MFFDDSLVHPDWKNLLEDQRHLLDSIATKLRSDSQDRIVIPPVALWFRAFEVSPTAVRVIILGQDPYPTPGHAEGLAFSVAADVSPLPRSLVNIFRELASDVGCTQPDNGSLVEWHEQGVLLLNTHLTTFSGETGGNFDVGWDGFIRVALERLVQINPHVVAILWGKHAQKFSDLFHPEFTIQSAHPSPLSAGRGFFGSKPFSRANEMLNSLGKPPIEWCLDSQSTN